MKLHEDREAFRVLIENIHEKTGYRSDVLEKDYYVTLFLYELSCFQRDGLPAYFKGGTALYKALKTTKRFSEDIDLSVDTRGCSRTQNSKRLERAAKKYVSLPRDVLQGKTNRSEVVAVYIYDPLTVFDKNDALQRFGRLKVEAVSFAISEPTEEMEVSALLYELANDEQKHILETIYEVSSFMVQTITLERIFIDKLFAAEAYVRQSEIEHRAFEAAKHIYDLAVMMDHSRIRSLLDSKNEMEYLLKIRLEEEQRRLDGIPGIKPSEFVFFQQMGENDLIHKAYEVMQSQYVLRDDDRIGFYDVVKKLNHIYKHLSDNDAWMRCQ